MISENIHSILTIGCRLKTDRLQGLSMDNQTKEFLTGEIKVSGAFALYPLSQPWVHLLTVTIP
jgi:hypothetical protein